MCAAFLVSMLQMVTFFNRKFTLAVFNANQALHNDILGIQTVKFGFNLDWQDASVGQGSGCLVVPSPAPEPAFAKALAGEPQLQKL